MLATLALLAALQTADRSDPAEDVFYQIMPIAWRDSDNDPVKDPHRFGDFGGLTDSLPYLKSLGVTGVWLNPIFPSPAYHGYQHGRADRVNPWFGTEGQFLAFVAAAHREHIKVYLDLVTYGISQSSEWFEGAHDHPESPFTKLLAFTDDRNSKFIGYDFHTWNGDKVGFINWDLRNETARSLVVEWSDHWLDPNGDGDTSDGVDGFRLDHVWAKYDKGPGGLGYNIDDFWKFWRGEIEKVRPDVFTFAEQAKWETHGEDLLSVHDAAFTKPLEFAAREALRTEKAAPLEREIAATLKALPPGRAFLGTLGDHDVDRLSSAIGADAEASRGRERAAAAVLMLGPFPPIIYSGDELGMLGRAGNYGTDANDIPRREPFKWKAAAGAPMSNYYELNKACFDARYSRDHDSRSVEEEEGRAGSLLETYRTLIALRRASPALTRGTYEPLTASDPGVLAFLRVSPAQTMAVAINLTGKAVKATVAGGKGPREVELPPYGYSCVKVEK